MPDVGEREQICKKTVPQKCPLAKDVNFLELAQRYAMCGGSLKNTLLRAATSAALRTGSDNAMTMEDLTKACAAEEQKTRWQNSYDWNVLLEQNHKEE